MKKIVVCWSVCGLAATIRPTKLSCENQPQPLIDVEHPRFSWVNSYDEKRKNVAQGAYRIRVATSQSGLESAPVWDSGKQKSTNSLNIRYEGESLRPQQDYWLQVQVWDSRGEASEWSRPCRFHTGILDPAKWRGEWIGAPWQGEDSYDVAGSKEVSPAPLLRKEFVISKPVESVLP